MLKRMRLPLVIFTGVFLGVVCFSLLHTGSIPNHASICEKGKDSDHKDCTEYGIAYFPFIEIAKFLDDHNGGFVAIFTLVLVVIGWRQASISKSQTLISEEQAKIAQRQYIAANGPKITVAIACLVRNEIGLRLQTNSPLNVAIRFRNIGKTKGKIIDGGWDLGIRKGAFRESCDNASFIGLEFDPGADNTANFATVGGLTNADMLRLGQDPLRFRVWFVTEDESGVRQYKKRLFRYNPDNGVFRKQEKSQTKA